MSLSEESLQGHYTKNLKIVSKNLGFYQPWYNPSRTPPRDLYMVRGAVITSHRFCDNESNSRSLSWSSAVYPECTDISMHRLHSTDTAMCAVRRPHNTFSDRCFTTARPRHHACETHYLLNYDNVTVSGSSHVCWRHTCSGTTTLCDILVKSAV